MTTKLSPEHWEKFQREANLVPSQTTQFKTYLDLLLTRNQEIDLTAITEPDKVLAYHFLDSLAADQILDMSKVTSLADIGTGAGFPALPLKIKYPHIKMVLIEVTHKRIVFLEELIKKLEMKDIEICAVDWRTFLRKTSYPIDLFVTRAALEPAELLRMYKPASPYNTAELLYWASKEWHAGEMEQHYLKAEYQYKVGERQRKLVLFTSSGQTGLHTNA